MQDAFSYQVINSQKSYSVYTHKELLGSLQKNSGAGEPVSIEIKEHLYKLEIAGIINPVISVIDTITNEVLGKIKISSFGRLFPKVIFEYKSSRLKWVSKSFFSLHWQWIKNEVPIIETVENFQPGKQKGVIRLSDYFADSDLLIMMGVYLRNNIRALPLNRFSNTKTKAFFSDNN